MKTAVEWFAERIQSDKIFNFETVLSKAKEMEKEQINNAHYEGSENYRRQYYNETFKSEQCK
jgi:predicted ABC-type ATPase